MASFRFSALFVIFSLVIATSIAAAHGGGLHEGWFPVGSVGGCRGSECMAMMMGAEEFDLDSESSRRILATSNYISYGALQRNSVPCSRRGASYYNCQPGASSNPYSRGCSAIARCRS